MKISNKLAASCLVLFSFSAQADIASDITEGKSMQEIFTNAQADNKSLSDIFSLISASDQNLLPDATTYATCQKLDTPETVTGFAFLAIPDNLKGTVTPPETVSDLVKDVANAAIACGLDKNNLSGPALAGGVDPTAVAAATAAGSGTGGGGPGVAGTGTAIGTPGFNGAGATNNAASIN